MNFFPKDTSTVNPESNRPKAIPETPGSLSDKANQDLPLTTKEAYSILVQSGAGKTISDFVFHFRQLFNVTKSHLEDVTDNRQFLLDLTAVSMRLIDAIENKRPYPTLFGDLILFKIQLQKISRYYQEQLDRGQPVARRYIRDARKPNSQLINIVSHADQRKSLLDSEESELLIQYTVNYTANDTMTRQVHEITEFSILPFLLDHSKEPDFSYCRP